MPTSGRSKRGGSATRAAPTTAPAACDSAARQMLFRPYRPPAHSIIVRSGVTRSGAIRCECAMVDNTTLGTPRGRAAATSSARSVPMLPPSISTPLIWPSRQACSVSAAAPCAMAVMAVFSSPQLRSASSAWPPARATASLRYSGAKAAGAITPTSMNSGVPPAARTRSPRYSNSSLLVSAVPMIRMRGTSALLMRHSRLRQKLLPACCTDSPARRR